MPDKRTAALAAFDRILSARRLALATSEKALAAFDVKRMTIGGAGNQPATEVVIGGTDHIESGWIRDLVADIDHCRNIIAVMEYEREVLFGADPRPEGPPPPPRKSIEPDHVG